MKHGAWEPEQTAALLPLLDQGGVVLNVGANSGYYALLAGAAVAPSERVHAFEIQPRMAELLRRNVEHNGLGEIITVVESGCYSSRGEAVIEEHGDPGSARIAFEGSGTRIPLITLDEYVRDNGIQRVDAILIDTEGADFEVLKGAKSGSRAGSPPVCLQKFIIWPRLAEATGIFCASCSSAAMKRRSSRGASRGTFSSLRSSHGHNVAVSPVVVTVIIPVFNRVGMIAEAIASALAAAEVEIEVVVVDDASTDDTWSVLQDWNDLRVRPLRLAQNGGQSVARNHGLDAARGRYVKFLDSDDVLWPGHLREEIRALDDGADIAVSGWRSENADGTVPEFDAPVFRSVIDDVLAGVAVPTSSALYRRRSDWRWDPSLRKLDDWDYFCQAALGASTIATVPGPAYVMRHHSGTRATDAGMLANAREHHHILHKIEQRLAREGELTDARCRRLAQYFYKELRVLCLHDRIAFESALRHIEELDPQFAPRDEERQPFMRVLARLLGVRAALRLHTSVKRLVKATTG